MLIRCNSCEAELSRRASTCPECGHPTHSLFRLIRSLFHLIQGIVITMGILFLMFHEEIHSQLGMPDEVDNILHRIFGADDESECPDSHDHVERRFPPHAWPSVGDLGSRALPPTVRKSSYIL